MKVVCVDDNWELARFDRFYFPNGLPVAGRVYAVLSAITIRGQAGYLLVGFPAIYTPTGEDLGFFAWRFRNLNELKQTKSNICHIKT